MMLTGGSVLLDQRRQRDQHISGSGAAWPHRLTPRNEETYEVSRMRGTPRHHLLDADGDDRLVRDRHRLVLLVTAAQQRHRAAVLLVAGREQHGSTLNQH